MQSHPAGRLPPAGGRLGAALRRRLKKHAGEALRRLHTASEDDPTFRPVGEAQLHRPGAHAQAALMICRLITKEAPS
jgi:hypothetical protein